MMPPRSTLFAVHVPSRWRRWMRCLLWLLAPALLLALPGVMAAGSLELNLPTYLPTRLSCGASWQISQRVAGSDGGVGFLIEAGYDQGHGSGRLLRRPLTANADTASAGAAVWNAAAVLDGGQPPPAERRIFTTSATGAVQALEWPSLDAFQLAAFDPVGDGRGAARLAYLRGDRSGEGALLRPRASLLGAIVRSVPVLLGAPSARGPGAGLAAYGDFQQRYRQRQALVFAGAGDGMLHAFDWKDGTERYAFVPRLLLPAAAHLGDVEGDAGVGFDGSPGVGEALIGEQWRSVLIAGMGMGARGLIALDVSDPAVAPPVLWEFGAADDAAIGFIHSAPQVIKLRIAAARGTPAGWRYFAAVSNGINPADGTGGGALFLLALDKAPGTPWRLGENYYKLAAVPESPPASANPLAAPAITVTLDGAAHSAYAGDRQGTMWRFDLSEAALRAATPASVLFRASAASGAAQPIIDAARVVFAPGGGYLVLFGTGQTWLGSDWSPAIFVQQTFYAVRDSDARPIDTVAGRAALAERVPVAVAAVDDTEGGSAGFRVAGKRFDYSGAGAKQGWYVDFPRALPDGERNAASPQLVGNAVVIRSSAPGADPCAPIQRAYVLDSLSGFAFDRRGVPVPAALDGDAAARAGPATGRAAASRDGLLPLVLVRGVVPAEPGPPRPTGARRALHAIGVFNLRAEGSATALDTPVAATPAGRLSWREIVNWRELHDAANSHP